MPQEKPKKKAMSNTPAGLGAKLGSAVRESFPLAASPLAVGANLGAKVRGYMDSKKKKSPSKTIHYLDNSQKAKGGSKNVYYREKKDKG